MSQNWSGCFNFLLILFIVAFILFLLCFSFVFIFNLLLPFFICLPALFSSFRTLYLFSFVSFITVYILSLLFLFLYFLSLFCGPLICSFYIYYSISLFRAVPFFPFDCFSSRMLTNTVANKFDPYQVCTR